jgi:hypothetical protein
MLYLSFRDCIGESLAFWFVLMELFVFVVVVVGGGFCRFCGGSSIWPRFDTVFLPCASMCKNHAAL